MNSGSFCLDANILITAWYENYPVDILPSLWEQLAICRNEFVLIKPIYDETDPITPHDRNKMSIDEKKVKYPLRMWMQENGFEATPINDAVNVASLMLEQEYQINPTSKGAGQNDVTLIAYAKITGKTLVTLEAEQKQKPQKKSKYKIPLICQEQGVEYINFVKLLRCLEIKI